jgi:polyhydroxybutyrate depolymerase
VVAAGGILLLLIWFALSQSPVGGDKSDANGSGGPAAAASDGGAAGAMIGNLGPDGMPATQAAPAPVPASGCGAGTQLPAGRADQTIKVGTVDRLYHLAVPAYTDPKAPLPLIFNFHGFGQTAVGFEEYTGLVVEGMSRGFVVVTPTGVDGRWNFVQKADVGPNDVAFVEATLNDLTGRGCLDPARVYGVGYGDGGDMAATVACALPGRFAAVAAVASSTFPPDCEHPPPGLLEVHGTADPVAPYEGGGPPRPAPFEGVQAQPVEQRLGAVATKLGCTGTLEAKGTSRLTRLGAWTGCPAGRDVIVDRVEGGGHTWLGADREVPELGPTVKDGWATDLALRFLAARPMPAS